MAAARRSASVDCWDIPGRHEDDQARKGSIVNWSVYTRNSWQETKSKRLRTITWTLPPSVRQQQPYHRHRSSNFTQMRVQRLGPPPHQYLLASTVVEVSLFRVTLKTSTRYLCLGRPSTSTLSTSQTRIWLMIDNE